MEGYVDDYYVDPTYKSDHRLLFALEIEDKKLKKEVLYPIFRENSHPRSATESQFNLLHNVSLNYAMK